jgi:hypothetical protein
MRKTFHHIHNLLLKTALFVKVETEFIVTRRKASPIWKLLKEELEEKWIYSTDVQINHSLQDKIKVYLYSNKQRTLTLGERILHL